MAATTCGASSALTVPELPVDRPGVLTLPTPPELPSPPAPLRRPGPPGTAARYGRAVTKIVVPRRFNGPPGSANGGYTCGLVAGFVDADVVEVSLRAPPPLETALEVESTDGGVLLRHGDTPVAEGHPGELSLEPPEPVDPETGERAARAGFERWSAGHPFPTCVICGPEREPGDGYCVFPGPLGDGDRFAASWVPDPTLADADGSVRPECVWGALDCPTSAPVANFGQGPPVVLARLTASLEAPVRAERPHALVSWRLGVDGRKRQAGAALFDADGRLLARSQALWIQLKTEHTA